MIHRALIASLFLTILFLNSGCSKSDDNPPCDALTGIPSTDSICLSFEHTGLSSTYRDIIESKITSGLSSINSLMPINDLRIRIVDNPQLVIPEIGIGGYNPNKEEVIIGVNANFNDLDATLEENFIPQLAHEIHHAKRRRSVGYGNTLLEAVVSEGLADHFSIEVTGITPPPWSVAVKDNELASLIVVASASWHQSYDHDAWFYGTGPDIPRWTGYSIGYVLVKNYLLANPGRMPSDLHNEPASAFQP